MGIQQICQSIKNLFNRIRTPFPQLPRLPLVCSLVKRPGLSTIYSTGNVAKDFGTLGIPTGQMPEGCENATIGFTYAIISEAFRALKEDASIQGGLIPNSMSVTAYGSNEGGPMVLKGMTVDTGKADSTQN